MNVERVTLEIKGLGCGGSGALTVERALASIPGVRRAYVNPLTETTYVEYDPNIGTTDALTRAVEAAGFRSGQPIRR